MIWLDRILLLTVSAVHIAVLIWISYQAGSAAKWAIDRVLALPPAETEPLVPTYDGGFDFVQHLLDQLYDAKTDIKLGRHQVAHDRIERLLYELGAA